MLYHPTPSLGVPPLDRLLEVFSAPVQAPLLAREPLPDADEDSEFYGQDESPTLQSTLLQMQTSGWKPTVIELTSSQPASGKTNLLYYITALAVLLTDHGGQGAAVVWFDTDGRFSAARLQEVMAGVVPLSTTDEDDGESVVQDALTHVHVFRPQSSRQLIETLDCLSSYLLDITAHSSIRRRLGLLVLDSATAFYWQDRFEAETARFEHPDAPRDKPSRATEIITRLKKVRDEFDCAVAYSTSLPFKAVMKAAHLSAVDTLAPKEPRSVNPWTAFANLTLILSRVEVPRFSSHMSLEECLRDREKRQEAVAKGRFVVEVDRSGSEGWTADVKEEWRRLETGGSFKFSIGTGVAVE